MSEAKDRPLDDDLEREIEEALGETSLLGVDRARRPAPPPARPPGADASREPAPHAFADATVAGVGAEDVFVEFGPRAQGVVPAEHFATPPTTGETVRVWVERFDPKEGLWLCTLKRALHAAAGWDTVEVGSVVNAIPRAVNKGGLDVQVGHLTGFLPASHAALERIEDLSVLIGQSMPVEVIESDPERRRLVVSRRAVLARQRDERRAEAVELLSEGQVVHGHVTRVERYGAFVDVGGVEGLVHVSQMSWVRVEDPTTVVKPGDEVDVQVLGVEEEGKRIRLGMKQLLEDPWMRFTAEHPPGSVVPGTVTRLQSYGAFVRVAEGIEGLAHVSQLSPSPVGSPREVVRIGQEVSVRVVDVDVERRRIGLSLLTERGDRLTDDVADTATIREVLDRARSSEPEPTLGDILKKALGGRGGS